MTVSTPKAAAARAVSSISAAARCRTPSGSPSPQMRAGRIAWWRSSMMASQTAWPTRWLEIAQHLRPYLSSSCVPPVEVAGVREGLVDLEVVAPAGEFEAVVAEVAGEAADLLQRQVGPLAGEEREVTGHARSLLRRGGIGRRVDGVLRGALLDRGEHPLHLEPVGEGRLGAAALGDGVHQVAGLVDEGVLVAEAVARRPPGLQVGVVGLGDEDAAEAGAAWPGSRVVVEGELVEALQVEGERARARR